MIDTKRFTSRLSSGLRTLLRSKWSWLAFTVLVASAIVLAIPSSPDSPHLTGIKSQEVSTMGQGDVPAAITLSPNETKKEYVSPVFDTDYEFNAIAPHWKEVNAEEESRTVEIRTSTDGREWSGWLEVEAVGPLRDNDPHPDRTFTENPLFITGRHFQYRLSLSRADLASPPPEISDLKVAYIDSRGSSAQRFVKKLATIKSRFTPSAMAADQGPQIISRAEWGSPDPHGGLFKGTDKDWVPEGSPAKQVFIHHTVNPNVQSDPKAVVRAIWEFHANTRGWGDIGYNYVLDGNGAIYEGRVGGDNIVGGHVLGYNRGSLGVAIIGCYDSASSTCNELNGGTTNPPSNSVLHGLTELLAWKTTNFEIDPKGTQTFCNSSGGGCLALNNIAGHKDANQTSCPGDLLYGNLPFIRDETNRKKGLYAYGYSAKQESYEIADLRGADTITHTLKFKNTGSSTWSNTTNRLLLKTANPNDRNSAFQGTGWLDNTTLAALNEVSVAPGGIGSFTFSLKRPSDAAGSYYEGYRLFAEGVGELRAFYTLPILAPIYSSAYAGQSPYPTIVQGQQAAVSISYKNTSNTSWYDDISLGSAPSGTKPIHLATSRAFDRASDFGSTWGGDRNRPAAIFAAVYQDDGVTPGSDQHVAVPGQIVKFSFTLSAPSGLAPGSYREYFQLVVEGFRAMNDAGTYLDVVVEPAHYASAYKAQSAYPTLVADNATQTAWIEYYNTGNQPWHDDIGLSSAPAGTKPIHLATSREINRRSDFGGSWSGDRNRPTVNFTAVYKSDGEVYATNPHAVQPGEAARFEFVVSAPFGLASGTYREHFQPIVEGGTMMNDPGTHLDMKVSSPLYSSAYAGQCPYPTLVIGGDGQTCFLSYKNVGNTYWYDDTSLGAAPPGTKPIHLSTSHSINRHSLFGSAWGGDRNRPAMKFAAVYEPDGATLAPDQHIARPGQIVKFSFTLSAASGLAPGVYREYFQPLVEGGTVMNDPYTYLDVTAQ